MLLMFFSREKIINNKLCKGLFDVTWLTLLVKKIIQTTRENNIQLNKISLFLNVKIKTY
jgi:hypothetical protein